eukprot:m.4449 g.4449  ORF g.4449 m.4449 type:complete len:431 (-) comp2227_c1_seq1:1330-2622(-)
MDEISSPAHFKGWLRRKMEELGEDESVAHYITSLMKNDSSIDEALERCQKGLPDLTDRAEEIVDLISTAIKTQEYMSGDGSEDDVLMEDVDLDSVDNLDFDEDIEDEVPQDEYVPDEEAPSPPPLAEDEEEGRDNSNNNTYNNAKDEDDNDGTVGHRHYDDDDEEDDQRGRRMSSYRSRGVDSDDEDDKNSTKGEMFSSNSDQKGPMQGFVVGTDLASSKIGKRRQPEMSTRQGRGKYSKGLQQASMGQKWFQQQQPQPQQPQPQQQPQQVIGYSDMRPPKQKSKQAYQGQFRQGGMQPMMYDPQNYQLFGQPQMMMMQPPFMSQQNYLNMNPFLGQQQPPPQNNHQNIFTQGLPPSLSSSHPQKLGKKYNQLAFEQTSSHVRKRNKHNEQVQTQTPSLQGALHHFYYTLFEPPMKWNELCNNIITFLKQ